MYMSVRPSVVDIHVCSIMITFQVRTFVRFVSSRNKNCNRKNEHRKIICYRKYALQREIVVNIFEKCRLLRSLLEDDLCSLFAMFIDIFLFIFTQPVASARFSFPLLLVVKRNLFCIVRLQVRRGVGRYSYHCSLKNYS